VSLPLPAVIRWADAARAARDAAGLSPEDLPLSVILALVHVESAGDPTARRPGSQFHGLLQIGWSAAIDGGLVRDPRTGRAWPPSWTPSQAAAWRREAARPALDPELALGAFCRIVARYRGRTLYPHVTPLDGVAILWKGGAGTARTVQTAVQRGTPLSAALATAEATVPRLTLYVERARTARLRYRALDD
jgi:hypothetical protein